MTDARLRLIVLAGALMILLGTCATLWSRGLMVPTGLQDLTSAVVGVFVGHVYMNGLGGGGGGPGVPKP